MTFFVYEFIFIMSAGLKLCSHMEHGNAEIMLIVRYTGSDFSEIFHFSEYLISHFEGSCELVLRLLC